MQGSEQSAVYQESVLNLDSFKQAVELCSGIGGISVGARHAGIFTKLFVDHSPLACEAIRLNSGRVIFGKVEDSQVQQEVHAAIEGQRAVFLAGFPCQPYSAQGAGKGLADPRGATLKAILRTAWLCRASALLLECVSEVAGFEDTMQVIRRFADVMHFQVSTVILELAHQWPSRRRRWWCALVPQGCPLVLYNWNDLSRDQTIANILPVWPAWDWQEEADLQWTAAEASAYDNPEFGSDARRLNMQGVAPTALHSYGCALRPCPCGCRAAAFTEGRLLSHGLRGYGIWSAKLGAVRLPHPLELGILNTLPLDYLLPSPPRSGLCLVGQLAAPLQALWTSAQIMRWAEETYGGHVVTCPVSTLVAFKQALLKQAQQLCQQQGDSTKTQSLQQAGQLNAQAIGASLSGQASGVTQVQANVQTQGANATGQAAITFAQALGQAAASEAQDAGAVFGLQEGMHPGQVQSQTVPAGERL